MKQMGAVKRERDRKRERLLKAREMSKQALCREEQPGESGSSVNKWD